MPSVSTTAPPVNLPPRPARKRRRRNPGPATWSSIGAFCAREKFFLALLNPTSPRIRPTTARVRWLERHPGMAATETMEEAA